MSIQSPPISRTPRHDDLPRPLLLVGMMASGKSTLASFLADHYRVPIIDTDHGIQQTFGIPITQIFRDHGEAAFRAEETKHLIRALRGPPAIISAGGGAFLSDAVRKAAKAHAFSLWLEVSAQTVQARTTRSKKRPLLNTGDRKQMIKQLTQARDPIYGLADITINANRRPAQVRKSTVRAIDDWIKQYHQAPHYREEPR
ncbi:MAG: shikimate kinase [Pseudomonadota bacterium]